MKGKIYKKVRDVSGKPNAYKVANSMRRKGYARVTIKKVGRGKYEIWAFC